MDSIVSEILIMTTDLVLLFLIGLSLIFSIFVVVCIIILGTTKAFPTIKRSEKEKFYLNTSTGSLHLFPHLADSTQLHLSVVIPAYNEEHRLPPMLDECIQVLEDRAKRKDFKYEIIVVSDGSSDKTVEVAHGYSKRLGCDKFRVLELETNRGKGGAVRLGMLSARGSLLLFADADGATKFSDLIKLESAMTDVIGKHDLSEPETSASKLGIAIGSRAHLEDDTVARRTLLRTILQNGFHFLVWLFAVQGLKDTQCGFKLFTRQAALQCFESLHIERWAFDVELLHIAQHLKIPIAEVAVNWTEIEGSKITPFWTIVQMAVDLGLIWIKYQIGAWKILSEKKK